MDSLPITSHQMNDEIIIHVFEGLGIKDGRIIIETVIDSSLVDVLMKDGLDVIPQSHDLNKKDTSPAKAIEVFSPDLLLNCLPVYSFNSHPSILQKR